MRKICLKKCSCCGRLFRFGLWEILTAEQQTALGELEKCDDVEIIGEIGACCA